MCVCLCLCVTFFFHFRLMCSHLVTGFLVLVILCALGCDWLLEKIVGKLKRKKRNFQSKIGLLISEVRVQLI